jgi:hypothetical protein
MLFDLLDSMISIEDVCIAEYAGEQAEYVDGTTRNTMVVLNDSSGRLLKRLKHLRNADTRTIIVRCSSTDGTCQDGGKVLADMWGFVMTLYPRSLRAEKKTVLSEVDPELGDSDQWGKLLSVTIIHEMFHLEAGHDGKTTSAPPHREYKHMD